MPRAVAGKLFGNSVVPVGEVLDDKVVLFALFDHDVVSGRLWTADQRAWLRLLLTSTSALLLLVVLLILPVLFSSCQLIDTAQQSSPQASAPPSRQ
eukprot:SAG31_NODE_24668_length_476_cov_1.506631_1_plen_95_part_10